MLFATSTRIRAIQTFNETFEQARRADWFAWLFGQPNTLLPFETLREQLLYIRPRHQGVQQVKLDNIIGSVGRTNDFDRRFRPLNSALQHRWVQLYNLRETIGWEPVELYKVGDVYYVYDGHHRISVAKTAGATTIEANVQEYPTPILNTATSIPAPILATIPPSTTQTPCCSC